MQALLAASAAAGRSAMRLAISDARAGSSARGTDQCTTPSAAAVAPSSTSAPRISRLGERRTAQPRQPLRAAGAGDQAEPRFRQPDFGFVGRDAQIAGQRQFEAAAHGRAADLGQHDLRQRLDAEIEPLDAGNIGVHAVRAVGHVHAPAHFLQIGAGAEYLLVGADVQHAAGAPS